MLGIPVFNGTTLIQYIDQFQLARTMHMYGKLVCFGISQLLSILVSSTYVTADVQILREQSTCLYVPQDTEHGKCVYVFLIKETR